MTLDTNYRTEGKNIVLTVTGETNARVDYVDLVDVAVRVMDTISEGLEPVKLDAASGIQSIEVSQRVVFKRLTTPEKQKLRKALEKLGVRKW